MATQRPPTPEKLIRTAAREHSLPQLKDALEYARFTCPEKSSYYLQAALKYCARRTFLAGVEYLIDVEGAKARELHPHTLDTTELSIDLLEALYKRGWDPNTPPRLETDDMLLDGSCSREDVVKWLVDHGAPVDRGQFDDDHSLRPRPVPILQKCASLGSFSSFKLLLDKGAPISRRTLHIAAGRAALSGADPGALDDMKEEEIQALPPSERTDSARILHFLVNDLKLDVDQKDNTF